MRKQLQYLLLGFLLIHLSIKLNAQIPAFEIGKHAPPPEAKKKKNYYSNLIASTEDEFLVADRTSKGQIYTAYNTATLKMKETFTLDYPQVQDRDVDWVKRLFRTEETTSIYGYYNRKDDINTVYGKITSRNGKEIVKEKVLAKITASKKKYIGNLGQVLSKDQSKILIYRELTAKESEVEEIELWLYDDQLNRIYKKTMSFPYKNKQFTIQDYLVTNDGEVIIIAYWSPSREEMKLNPDTKNVLNFKVFGLTPDKEELEEISITKKGTALSSSNGWVLDSGEIIFTGYYRDGVDNRYQYGANGIYYVKVNTKNWEIETSHFSKIPKEDLARIFGAYASNERQKKRAEKAADGGAGLNQFILRGVFYNDNGSVKIISQVEYMVRNCYTDPRTHVQTCTYTFYNLQIIEFDLDAEGNIIQTILIPKSQISNTPQLQGHISLLSDSKTYFVFNDADKNFDPKKLDKHHGDKFYYTFKGSKARLAYAYVTKKGEAKKKALINDAKNNLLIFPGESIRVDRSTVITWGQLKKGKELLLVKFYLKEKEIKE
ncbi:MAG: hypothetical protein NTW54_00725 [Bacteroidetes bacterium]|nr:hypothetical protein [Bacteroidota bacterium]